MSVLSERNEHRYLKKPENGQNRDARFTAGLDHLLQRSELPTAKRTRSTYSWFPAPIQPIVG